MPLKFNPFTGTLDYTVSAAVEEKAKGIPEGGGTSTVLMKKSATNFDNEWKLVGTNNLEALKKLIVEQLENVNRIIGPPGGSTIEKVSEILGVAGSVVTGFTTVKAKTGIFETVEVLKKLLFAEGAELVITVPFALAAGGDTELLGNTNDLKFAKGNTTQPLSAIAAGVQLTGVAISSQAEGGKPWQLLILANAATVEPGFEGDIKLISESASSKVQNRFKLPEAETVLKFNQFMLLMWSPETKRWHQLTSPEELTAGEGLEVAARKMKIKALGITEGMLAAESISEGKIKALAVSEGKLAAEAVAAGKIKSEAVETTKIKSEAVTEAKIATNAVEEAKIKAEAVAKGKLAKAVQEELLTVAEFPASAAYTSAKEETEAKPTFITLVIKTKAEAAKAIVKFVNDAHEVVYEWDALVAGAQKLPITFMVKKGGKWKATLETAAESATIFRQVVNSV